MCFPMGACLHHTCGPEARAPRCVQGGIANLLIGAVVLGGPEARPQVRAGWYHQPAHRRSGLRRARGPRTQVRAWIRSYRQRGQDRRRYSAAGTSMTRSREC